MAENTDDRIRLTLSRSTGFTLDVDLTLPNGGVTVLFGVSGCGKTTVLRSAAGLEKAKGYVRIAGQVWQDEEKRILTDAAKVYVLKQKDVGLVMGENYNIKITTKYDLKMANLMLNNFNDKED